jgi:hypothetical protein
MHQIGAGSTHTYNVSFNVSLDLEPGSADGGDNIYTACGVVGNGPGSQPGQGLYNKAELDRNGDNITDITDDACGDLPYVTMVKNLGSVTTNSNGTYTVTYQVIVTNTGGATGKYSLKDTPQFDNDVTINSGNFSGHSSGSMNTSGSTTLATNATIAKGSTHTYIVSFNVSLNLEPGSADGGDNIYTACGVVGNGPGSQPGQGLYNKAELDRSGDGITDLTDDACGDLPYVTMIKNLVGVVPNANGTYTVNYSIVVNNIGGAAGSYSLKDTPQFDNDVTINSGSFAGQASGSMNTLGSTTLATNTAIAAGSTHTYNVSFNVSLNLESGSADGGDNIYTACGVVGNGPGSQPGQGLYNKAELDRTGDGVTDITDDACGDLPYVTMVKNLGSVSANANGTYTVTYQVIVNNVGGATGSYSLKDTPQFDNDVTINSGNFSGHASGAMNTSGSTSLAANATIAAGSTHTYNVSFNVSLNLEPGSTDGGDNIYTACGVAGNGPGSQPGQGLYNKAELDRNGDGITDLTDDACGDLPYVTMIKNLVGVVPNANGTYTVNYAIIVNNVGGATGSYSLKDTPQFDDDVTINSGSYSGQANGAMNTSGSTSLAFNATIAAGSTHTYNVSFNVSLNLEPGSTDGGDNIYTACGVVGNGPGSQPGQGLYNKAELDRNGDGETDITDDACGDLPYVKMVKNLVGVVPNANGTYTVNYSIVVNNVGGSTGSYSLKDTPQFDNDVTINSGSFSGHASGSMNTAGSTTLATNAAIAAGSTHTYNVSFNVSLNLEPGSADGGDNIYTACEVVGNGPGSQPGQGLYNKAELDRNGDGITDITDDACGDLPYVTMEKNLIGVVPNANGSYTVNYAIIVNNIGGATGTYNLKDTPQFDDDITINSGSFSGHASGVLNITGSTTLATNATIAAGSTHTYNLSFNVSIDLEPGSTDGGDNIYKTCGVTGNNPNGQPGQGLYNKAELDRNGDIITDISDDACGDLPYVKMVKNLGTVTANANGTYTVTYQVIVNNVGGATGSYSLKDTPQFDNDVTINSGNYSGQANGAMNTNGSTTLANNATIAAGSTHTYNVSFNVSLNLEPGSADGGDNVYTACGAAGNGPGSQPGQGLYNKAELDRNGDGITDITDDACGDLPYVKMVKNLGTVTANANGSYTVTYQVIVSNAGGAAGSYSLKDTPQFDNDVTINNGSYGGQANGAMNTNGSTTLATNVTIGAGSTHTYNVSFNVSLNLEPGSADGGDNVYTACGVAGNGPGSQPGQGLYNKAELDRNGDGITDITDDACGDLPYVKMVKNLGTVTANANGSYTVTYQVIVSNAGGAAGSYSLKDTPQFDNDVTINNGSYSGQASGAMNTSGSTTLATNATIAAGSTHTYNVSFNVSLNLEPGSADGGDNVYTACGVSGNGPGSQPGQGLYNKAELDRNGDGITDITDDACGDLPYVKMVKNLGTVTANANGSYTVTYQVIVSNAGGAAGSYSLKDTPQFDNDVTINNGSYSGQASGAMNTSGSTTLATNATIAAGSTHTYNVSFNVSLNLEPGSTDGGDNVYTACGVAGNGPGSQPGQGLYNKAELDRNGDGITDITDDACGDLPYVKMVKNLGTVTANANGSYTVTYQVIVSNAGGAAGSYSLKDTPQFDNDVTINNGSYSGQASGAMNTSGSTTLATNATIAAGSTHTYNVSFNVSLNLEPGSTDGGDNVYTACGVAGNGPGSQPGQGLYNKAELDRNGDGITDITDDACGDLPYVKMVKNLGTVTANANGTYTVTYQVIVNNVGGATGNYSLKDTPAFDDDVTILSGNYSGQASGSMNIIGSTTLANNTTIAGGATHIYNISFNVSLNLEPGSADGGDNIYTPCTVVGNGPGCSPGQGLYNKAELDRTGDGITDITDDACGDIPYVTMVKNLGSVVSNANGTYTVNYTIIVNNVGGTAGSYSLKDTPQFDNDVTINSGSYSGQASGAMNTSGSTTLATSVSIASGSTHTYNVSFNVSLNLEPGSADGGDNVYTACGVSGNGPGGQPGQGLYNKAELDRNGDNITDVVDDACGDLPYVTMIKNLGSVTANANGSYTVTYQILVKNNGGASGSYSLKDTPQFDNDVTINNGSYSGQASGVMNTSGGTTLATNVSIGGGTTHTYNVSFNVNLNLEPGSADGGDNIYTPCGVIGNGPGSQPGQGLYNKAELDRNGDGLTDITDDACGDIPYLTMKKNFAGVFANSNGSFTINYQIIVNNLGGAAGTYTLKDSPAFDDDVTILNGSFSGQASGAMNTNGSTTLANNASIAAESSHTYNVSFNVNLNLEPGSADGGDNIYTPCGVMGNGPGSQPGQGLYNKAELDSNGDGYTDITDDACGDIPYITMLKNLGTVTANSNGSYTVNYEIVVKNVGGAAGTYSLKDSPDFDDDVTIVSGSYSGQAAGSMNVIGSTTLANNATIGAGVTHTYNVSFVVTIDLAPGSADGGDNIYTPCTIAGSGPGCHPGQGLYNRAELDKTGDGITDITDDACGDLPYLTMVKNLGTVTANADGSYNVSYAILVSNIGGSSSTYSLKDTPLFDDDVTILVGNYSGQASGSMNLTGSTTLATGVNIAGGVTHTYNVVFTVKLDLAANSTDGGDNVYSPCEVAGNGPGSTPGHGLYNLAQLDLNGDGNADLTDDACGDIPYITMIKNLGTVTPGVNGSYNVTYSIIVKNLGGTGGFYTLKDTPRFDDDVVINSGSYSGQASGNMNSIGFTVLANHVSIGAGATHTYNVTFNVSLDLTPSSGGDNIYSPCTVVGNGPGCTPLYGLYNMAELDWNNDNIPDITDDACGDIPACVGNFVWHDLNGNGIQDSGEPGISNATVSLTDAGGNQVTDAGGLLVTPVTTGVDGAYEFTNLVPGQYIVKFTAPSGYLGTAVDKGTEATDSDADPITGKSHIVTLAPGVCDETVDAGFFKCASIGDYVWEDFNSNGIQDASEFGLEGVVVLLNGTTGSGASVSMNDTTDVDGHYLFACLAPGTYTITFGTLPGYTFTTQDAPGSNDANDSDANPTTGQTVAEVLTSGESNLTYDAGLFNLGSIGDRVWLDVNGNGLQDAGEVGVNGVNVNLYKDDNMDNVPDGTPIKTTVTATNSNGAGYYLFSNLAPGKYLVEFNPANTYNFTTQNVTGFANDANDVNTDSDATPFTGLSHTIVLLSGENDLRIDAGLYKPLCVGDQVWEDHNNNGVIDNGELPFAGVQLALWKDLDNDGQPDTDTGMRDVTGGNGKYLFTGLAPGHYVIQVTPANFLPGGALHGYTTSTGNGAMVDPDNDVNDDDNGFDPGLSLGTISKAVTLITDTEPGNDGDTDINTNLTVDFGFFRVSAIGDYVWEDENANGIQDATESGFNNVKVYLFRADHTLVDTMRTMSNPNQPAKQGFYLFDNLEPGSYYVKFDLPAGYFMSSANKGADDAKDSDVDGTNGPNTTKVYALAASQRDLTVDAGIYKEASLGDFVWIDYMNLGSSESNNAVQDTNDIGLNGVLVSLYNASTNALLEQMLTINSPVTGEPGWYLFDKLPSANYYIKVDLPQGYIFVTPNAGENDMSDSDIVDFINGTSLPLQLLPGEHIRDLDAGIKQEVVLPIVLVEFNGKHNDRNFSNELYWNTASEVNNDHFEVMRSLDGNKFESIGKVMGAGNAHQLSSYNLVDDKLIKGQPIYYYQLKQVDFDGNATLSNVVTIKVGQNIDRNVEMYPNPANELVNIRINGDAGDVVTANLMDNTGKLVMTMIRTELNQYTEMFRFDVSAIPSGVYMVNIAVGNKVFTQKLLIME